MFAIIAAIFFGVALLLDLLGSGHYVTALALAGLLFLALHMAIPAGLSLVRRD